MEEISLSEIEGFEWDEANREKSWIKHTVHWRESEEIFNNNPAFLKDTQHSTSEERFIAIGKTNGGRNLYIAFTIRKKLIRIISARDQNKKEYYKNYLKTYEKTKKS